MESRRQFLESIGLGVAVLAVGPLRATGGKTSAKGTERKPNFVFFLIDDLGWSDIGCYGKKFNETPNIDRLAAQGMRKSVNARLPKKNPDYDPDKADQWGRHPASNRRRRGKSPK